MRGLSVLIGPECPEPGYLVFFMPTLVEAENHSPE
jgi:hypothetical protein